MEHRVGNCCQNFTCNSGCRLFYHSPYSPWRTFSCSLVADAQKGPKRPKTFCSFPTSSHIHTSLLLHSPRNGSQFQAGIVQSSIYLYAECFWECQSSRCAAFWKLSERRVKSFSSSLPFTPRWVTRCLIAVKKAVIAERLLGCLAAGTQSWDSHLQTHL